MAKSWQLNIRAKADTKEAEGGLSRLGESGHKFAGVMAGFAAGAAFEALDKLGEVAKAGWEQMEQLEAVSALSEGAIHNLGKGSKLTVDGMVSLSQSIQSVTDVQDTQIQSAENMIANMAGINTATKAGMRVFDQSTKLTVNMAKAMGQTAPVAAKAMAKSLQQAANGILMLPKGMKLSSDQTTALAKKLKDLHNPTQRQAALLDVLNKKFGDPAPLTASQKLDVAKKTMTDLAASAEMKLVPALTAGAAGVSWLVREIAAGIHSAPFQNAMAQIAAVVRRVITIVRADWPIVEKVIRQAIAQVRQVIATNLPAIESIFRNLGTIVMGVVNIVEAIWTKFGSKITAVVKAQFGVVVATIKTAFNVIRDAFQLVADLVTGKWGKLWGDVKKLLGDALRGMLSIVKAQLKLVWAQFELVASVIGAAFKAGYHALESGASAIISGIGNLAKSVATAVYNIGKQIIDGIIQGIEHEASKLADKVSHLAGSIKSGFTSALSIHSPSRVMRDQVGRPVVQGIVAGMQKEHANLISAATRQGNALISAAEKVYAGKLSKALGSKMAGQIAAGITSGKSKIALAVQGLVDVAMQQANTANLNASLQLAKIGATNPGDVAGQIAAYNQQVTAAQTQEGQLQKALTDAQAVYASQGPTVKAYEAQVKDSQAYLAKLAKEKQTATVKAKEAAAQATLTNDQKWLATNVVTTDQINQIKQNLTDAYNAQTQAQQAIQSLQQQQTDLAAPATSDTPVDTGGDTSGTVDNSVSVTIQPQQWNGDPSMIAWFVRQAMQGGSNAMLGVQPATQGAAA